jgi:MFS family permease
MAAHATRPMVTYRALEFGATPTEIGLVQSAFSVLPLLTALAIGRWVDRIGEVRIIALGCASIGVGAIIGALSPSLWSLAVGQLGMGFGLISTAIATQALIANRGPQEQRVERFGWYAVAVSVGQLAGPAFGAALVVGLSGPGSGSAGSALSTFEGDVSVTPVFLLAAGVSVIATVLALMLPRRRPERTTGSPDARLLTAAWNALRRPGMAPAMFVSVVVTASVDVLIAYLPAYGAANGLGIGTVGALLSARAGASLVSRVFMGRVSRAIGLDRLLFASTAIACGGILFLPFVTAVPHLFILMVFIGLGLGVGQPMTVAWVASRSPEQERGLALSVRLTGNLAALLVVPTVMGILAGASGVSAIWVSLAILLGLGSLVAWRTPFDDLADDVPRRADIES